MDHQADAATMSNSSALHSILTQLTTKILDNSPVYSHMLPGIKLISCEPGRVEYTLALQPIHLNSHNTLHGAVSATIVDFIGGPVIASVASNPLDAARGVSTDISIQYLNAARQGDELRIVGRSKKVGRQLAWVGVEIWSRKSGDESSGRLCVEGSHTKFISSSK